MRLNWNNPWRKQVRFANAMEMILAIALLALICYISEIDESRVRGAIGTKITSFIGLGVIAALLTFIGSIFDVLCFYNVPGKFATNPKAHLTSFLVWTTIIIVTWIGFIALVIRKMKQVMRLYGQTKTYYAILEWQKYHKTLWLVAVGGASLMLLVQLFKVVSRIITYRLSVKDEIRNTSRSGMQLGAMGNPRPGRAAV